ncbi:hypothetical protein D9M68_776260 [compost metagenome]
MAGETLVSADAMDKAMIVSLFIGFPPFSPLVLKYTSERAQKHCVLTVRGAGYGAHPMRLFRTTARGIRLAAHDGSGRRHLHARSAAALDRGGYTNPQAITNYFILRNSIESIIAIQ